MNSLSLIVYGVLLRVEAEEPEFDSLIHQLREDFRFFESPFLATPDAQLEIRPSTGKHAKMPAVFKTKMCRVHGWSLPRLCDYGDAQIFATDARPGRRFIVGSENLELAYEITFQLILSVLGESLDQLGFHRVHALGGRFQGKSAIFLLPQGGGKSALAWQLLKHSDFFIASDESPLLRRGELFPFPMRGALAPAVAAALTVSVPTRKFPRKIYPTKVLFEIPATKVMGSAKLNYVFIGVKSSASARIEPTTRARVYFELFKSLVVGIGLAQMGEHLLRLNRIPALLKVAFSRHREAWQVSQASQTFCLHYGDNALENEKIILDFFQNFRT